MGTYGLNQILLGSVKVSRYLQAAHDLTPLAGRGSQEQWPVASECEAEEIAVIESAKDGNGDAASIDRAEKLSASLFRSPDLEFSPQEILNRSDPEAPTPRLPIGLTPRLPLSAS